MKKKPRDKKTSPISNFFKKVNVASKKNAERDKAKKAQKNLEKKNAVFKPKGYRNRKLGVITFWGMFAVFGGMSVVNFMSDGEEQVVVQEVAESGESFNYRGAEFGRDFLQVYFNWDDDESKKNRIEMLKHYTTPNVSNDSEFNTVTTDWTSSLSRDDITLIDTQSVSNTRSIHTYKVSTLLSKSLGEYENVLIMNETAEQKRQRSEAEETEDENESEKALDELAEKDVSEKVTAEIMQVEKPKEQKTDVKFVSVVVDYVKDLNRYVITEMPSFVGYDMGLQIATENNSLEKLETAERHDADAVNEFLTTFFRSYSEDDYDKLSYILKDENFTDGLMGNVSFDGIRHSLVYKSPNDNEFIVKVNVGYIDEKIQQKYTSTYHLIVEKTSDKYVVKKINDMKYIENLLKNGSKPKDESSHNENEDAKSTESKESTESNDDVENAESNN